MNYITFYQSQAFKQYLFSISGRIVGGNQLGRTIDMPTANLEPIEDCSDIACGVYAVMIRLEDEMHQGITHIGPRPSVDDSFGITIETYIFDFEGDIYDKEVTVFGFLFIRDTKKFDTIQQLKAQVDKDISVAIDYLNNLY